MQYMERPTIIGDFLVISHLAEHVQVSTTDWQQLLSAIQVDTSGLVLIAADVASRIKIDHH
jgi:hypothetical protein